MDYEKIWEAAYQAGLEAVLRSLHTDDGLEAISTRNAEADAAAIAVLRQHFEPTGDEQKCYLCAGKCRGHSLGRESEWVPEVGSQAWQEEQPTGDDGEFVQELKGVSNDLGVSWRIQDIAEHAAARITADQARIAELERKVELLRVYASHDDECAINGWLPRGPDFPCPSCTCGLIAALGAMTDPVEYKPYRCVNCRPCNLQAASPTAPLAPQGNCHMTPAQIEQAQVGDDHPTPPPA